MTVISRATVRRQHSHNGPNTTTTNNNDSLSNDRYKARLFLIIACFWPLALFVLAFTSSPSTTQLRNERERLLVEQFRNRNSTNTSRIQTHQQEQPDVPILSSRDEMKLKFFNILDRVDILGYGPTHPRLAVVIVGDSDTTNVLASYESILSNTDFNRLFIVCIVMDGVAEDTDLVAQLQRMNNGMIPHWHGLRPDVHKPKKSLLSFVKKFQSGGEEQDTTTTNDADGTDSSSSTSDEEDPHGQKIHVIFNDEKLGITRSRQDAIEFIHLLEQQHENAGLKSVDEDIILLLLQSGSRLLSHKWLQPVTEALIIPPPTFGGFSERQPSSSTTTRKMANAISFNLEGTGKVTSFDVSFKQITTAANSADITLSNGASYPTPVFNGGAIAMRLQTYLNLPMQDTVSTALVGLWESNLDLAMNIWLCGDGIDIIKDVEITHPPVTHKIPHMPLSPAIAARFAIAWMDEYMNSIYYRIYKKQYQQFSSTKVSYLDWQTYQANAKSSPTFTAGLPHKCRTFQWFMNNVIPDTQGLLFNISTVVEDDNEDSEEENGNGEGKKAEQHEHVVKKNETLEQPLQQEERKNQEGDASIPKVNKDETIGANQTGSGIDKKESDDTSSDTINTKPPIVNETKQSLTNESITEKISLPERNNLKKPSKPLCEECLSIVQKVQPIDIAFVDVRGNMTQLEHPHMGAYDGTGTQLGYIHNETSLHDRTPKPKVNYSEMQIQKTCETHDNNWRMIHEKIIVDTDYDKNMNQPENIDKRIKLFCLVYTTESGHHRIPAIRETWGNKCDGFMVASNKTDPSIDAVNIPHEGEESYGNIWQKVRSMWSYVYDNYYEKYDWFHIGGDDLFIIVENLKYYLESEEIRTAANGGIFLPEGNETIQTPLFLGRRFAYQGDMNDVFNSGGSGYTLNKAALKTLVVHGLPQYSPHAHTFSEDSMVARVLRNFGVFPYETKDEYGGERYMPFMPGHHYGYRIPQNRDTDWYAKYSINIKEGVDHCAARSVAFHYVKDEDMYRLHVLFYKLCPAETQ